MDVFIGFIAALPYTFAPTGWQACDGSLIPIAQNQAMFALLGTQFGGNGTSNFAVPDLRGRTIIGTGTAASGTVYLQGNNGGVESVTLSTNQMPAHNHPTTIATPNLPLSGSVSAVMNVNGSATGAGNASGSYLANLTANGDSLYAATTDNTKLNAGAITVSQNLTASLASAGITVGVNGSGLPHENRMPFVAINYCIATTGLYPSHP